MYLNTRVSPCVHTGLWLWPVVGRTRTRYSLWRFDFWFIFCYNNSNTVNGNFPRLRRTSIDVFQPRRMTSFFQRPFVFLFSFLVARSRQELTRYLLGHKLRINPRFPRRSPLSNITHQTFKSLRCISKGTHTAIPTILHHFRLTLSSSNGTLFVIHFNRVTRKNHNLSTNWRLPCYQHRRHFSFWQLVRTHTVMALAFEVALGHQRASRLARDDASGCMLYSVVRAVSFEYSRHAMQFANQRPKLRRYVIAAFYHCNVFVSEWSIAC